MGAIQAALLAAAGLAALTNWWAIWRNNRAVEAWSKPLTTMLVIGLAIANDAEIRLAGIAVLALVLCLEGDVALLPSIDNFIVGLTSFLLGHLVFIVLFVRFEMPHRALGAIAIGGSLLLIGTVGRLIVGGAARTDPALRWPVLAYLLVISAMVVCGWATGRGWVIAGTTLFVLSDALLGWSRFVSDGKTRVAWREVAMMVTYHGAIASLALSLW